MGIVSLTKILDRVVNAGEQIEEHEKLILNRRNFLQLAALAVPVSNQFTRNDEQRILSEIGIADYHLKNGKGGTNKFKKNFFDTVLGNGISGYYTLDDLGNSQSGNKVYESTFKVEAYDGKEKIYESMFRSFFENEKNKLKVFADCRKVMDKTGKFETVTIYDYTGRNARMRTIDGKAYGFNTRIFSETQGFWPLVARGIYFKDINTGKYPSVVSTGANLFSREVEVNKTDDDISYSFSALVDGKNQSFNFVYNQDGSFFVKIPGMPMGKSLD